MPEKSEFQPTITEVEKPLKDIIEALLQYRENGRNPFQITSFITGTTGRGEDYVSEISLDNPASLEQSQYSIVYMWGRTDEEYTQELVEKEGFVGKTFSHDRDLIAILMKHQEITFIKWNPSGLSNRTYLKSEKGYKELEKILKS